MHDYRGIGDSRGASLRGLKADKLMWAEQDMSAALRVLRERAGALPVYWLGHSLGAQLVGLVDGFEAVRAMVSVGAGVGIWWKMLGNYRWYCFFIWYLYMPLTIALCGYAPARAIRQGQDLPKGVAEQWSRWCRSASYFGDYLGEQRLERLRRVSLPWWSISFSDDPIANRVTIPDLMRFYPGAKLTLDILDPQALGQKQMGHHGFFMPARGAAMWPRLVEFLKSQ